MCPAAETELGGDEAAAGRRGGWRQSALGTLGTGSALIAGQAATGVALLVLARRSTPRSFGAFVALYAVSTAVGGLIDFGSSKRATRELAQGLGRAGFLGWLHRRTALQFPMVAAATALALLLRSSELPWLCVVALGAQALTLAYAQGTLGAVRALRSPIAAEWLVFTGNVLILLTAILAPARQLLTAVACAAALSWVICAAGAFLLVRGLLVRPTTRGRGNPWKGSASFGFASLAIVAQGFLLLVVEHSAGAAQAGALGAVQKWTQPIGLVAAAYGGYLFPSLSAASTDRSAIRAMRSLIGIVALGVAACSVIIVLAPQLVDILLGSDYHSSVRILQLLLVASLPELVVHPLSVLLQARGADRPVAWTLMVLSVGGLIGVALLAPHLGNAAVPLVDGISYGVALAVFVSVTRRLWRRNARLSTADG